MHPPSPRQATATGTNSAAMSLFQQACSLLTIGNNVRSKIGRRIRDLPFP